MIDPHVHLRDWNQAEKETVKHGLSVAKSCGFTHVFDMPNTNPPLTDRKTILKRFELAKGIEGITYHLWAGITADPEQIAEMVSVYNELYPRVVGLKMFFGQSTGNMGICDYETQLTVFRKLKELNYRGVVAIHAEKESLLQPERYIQGRFETHSLARPAVAEIESVRDAITIVEQSGFEGTLHIAHVSTKGAIEEIMKAREKMRITMGVTPHHALFTMQDAADHDRYLKMNPPLRGEEDRRAVFVSLLDGTATWIESDHAPHTRQQKESGASGIPGFENMLLLIETLRKAGISETRLHELTYQNAAELFSLDV
ncbi:MAG: dihydroorotase family protein [Clostridiales bacterium]|nr:dihydroorotase family protein [Candidatus Crickella caballi]